MFLLLIPLHNITITFTINKKIYKYFTNKNHRQYLKDGCNTTDDPLSRFLSLAWRTSSTIRPPSTLTAAVTTRLTRMVRAPWFMATRTPSSAVMVTQVSVLPSSTWWETCCRVSASWWRRPSSTSGSDKQMYYMI